MPEKSRLMPISYFNPKQEIRLSAYADTIVLEPDGREQRLRAIRFGGYPEMVRAMADAIYAWGEEAEGQRQQEGTSNGRILPLYEKQPGTMEGRAVFHIRQVNRNRSADPDGRSAAKLPRLSRTKLGYAGQIRDSI